MLRGEVSTHAHDEGMACGTKTSAPSTLFRALPLASTVLVAAGGSLSGGHYILTTYSGGHWQQVLFLFR